MQVEKMQADKWQTIDSAPLNGRVIKVGWLNKKQVEWHFGYWKTSGFDEPQWADAYFDMAIANPTHWSDPDGWVPMTRHEKKERSVVARARRRNEEANNSAIG